MNMKWKVIVSVLIAGVALSLILYLGLLWVLKPMTVSTSGLGNDLHKIKLRHPVLLVNPETYASPDGDVGLDWRIYEMRARFALVLAFHGVLATVAIGVAYSRGRKTEANKNLERTDKSAAQE